MFGWSGFGFGRNLVDDVGRDYGFLDEIRN
jgi:hypothetical protein